PVARARSPWRRARCSLRRRARRAPPGALRTSCRLLSMRVVTAQDDLDGEHVLARSSLSSVFRVPWACAGCRVISDQDAMLDTRPRHEGLDPIVVAASDPDAAVGHELAGVFQAGVERL